MGQPVSVQKVSGAHVTVPPNVPGGGVVHVAGSVPLAVTETNSTLSGKVSVTEIPNSGVEKQPEVRLVFLQNPVMVKVIG